MAMPDAPTVEQAGTATVWFTSQAGITATVLAFVCLGLAGGLVWAIRTCRRSHEETNASWLAAIDKMQAEWGRRQENFRSDVKEAFNQNDEIADKVVEALNGVKIEVARMSGRRDRD